MLKKEEGRELLEKLKEFHVQLASRMKIFYRIELAKFATT